MDAYAVAESFSMAAGTEPATSTSLKWPWDRTRKNRLTRSIPITSSICLDFASTSPFSALSQRPSLILAPARTWHIGAGLAMWEQAKARAEEIGSTILWCDGGEGGVSGIAGVGAGTGQILRVGQGSWLTTVAIPWPLQESRTTYAAGGDWMALAIVWSLAGAPELLRSLLNRSSVRAPLIQAAPGLIVSGARAVWGTILEKGRLLKSSSPTPADQQPLLG